MPNGILSIKVEACLECGNGRFSYNTPEKRITKVWRNNKLTQVRKYTCVHCGGQFD